MPGGLLIYKILVLVTLLIGTLSLVANLKPGHSHRARARGRWGGVRGPLNTARALLRDDPVSPSSRVINRTVKETISNGGGIAQRSDEQWQAELTAEQFQVTRRGGTERPFSGKYWDHYEAGTYHCVGCGQELFDSVAKFESGSGWPSYYQPASPAAVTELKDISYGTVRTEVICSRCEAHLGHVFSDGPRPTGLRYCINSAALAFRPGPGTAAVAGDAAGKLLS